jgi:hypothetical protein
MATKLGQGKSGGPKQDPLVDQLSPEPDSAGPFVLLYGFVGKSPQDGNFRLYSTPKLDEFAEIRSEDVHHSEPLTPAESALGGSRVWLKPGSVFKHTVVTSRQVQADFLGGAIASRHMGAAAPSGGATRGLVRCLTQGRVCMAQANSVDLCRTDPLDNDTLNQHIPACRSDGLGHCGGPASANCGMTDGGPFCGTGAFVCGQSAGCTGGVECGIG